MHFGHLLLGSFLNGPGKTLTVTIDPVLSWIKAVFSVSGLGVDLGDLVVTGAATACTTTERVFDHR